MKNNRGFTLIELMVVVAIVSILVGAMTYSINSVSSTRAKKFASDLNAMISQCRVDTMSGAPSPTYLEISQDENGDYYGTLYEGGAEKAKQKLGGSGISCSFITDSIAAQSYSISGNNSTALYLAFDRATGAFSKLTDVKSSDSALNVASGNYCTSITIASGGGSYTITLVPNTGYHSVGR